MPFRKSNTPGGRGPLSLASSRSSSGQFQTDNAGDNHKNADDTRQIDRLIMKEDAE